MEWNRLLNRRKRRLRRQNLSKGGLLMILSLTKKSPSKMKVLMKNLMSQVQVPNQQKIKSLSLLQIMNQMQMTDILRKKASWMIQMNQTTNLLNLFQKRKVNLQIHQTKTNPLVTKKEAQRTHSTLTTRPLSKRNSNEKETSLSQ